MNLKEALKNSLNEEELRVLRKGFEIIGDVAIIEIPEVLEHRKQIIVDAILKAHKHLKTVLRKRGEVSGIYRIASYEILHGIETETTAKEFGCRYRLDPTKVYYSSKLSNERDRIAHLAEDGETILVMFAGVGPYAILLAKRKDVDVTGVEINPVACEYFRENVRLNKVENRVRVICGDVRDIVPGLNRKFDRVVMPSPFIAEEYVDLLPYVVKKGSTVHYYTIAGEEEKEALPVRIENEFKKHGMVAKTTFLRRVGSYAPRVNRYVLDIKIHGLNESKNFYTF